MTKKKQYVCPLGNDIKAIEKDAWAFHMQHRRHEIYNGGIYIDDLLLTVSLNRKIESKKTLAYWKTVAFYGGVHIWARKKTERQHDDTIIHSCTIPFDKLATCEHCARVDYKSRLTYVGMKHMVGTKVKRKSFLCDEYRAAREHRRQQNAVE